jgi:hypothetical protein
LLGGREPARINFRFQKGGSKLKKSTKRFISTLLATSMAATSVFATPVFATDNTLDAILSAYATSATFDATTLTAAADKEAVTASELSAPFGISGTVTKRISSDTGAVTSVEVDKAAGGAITVTVDGPTTISAVMSSTGSANTSAIAITDASGNVLKSDTVTGSSDGKKTLSVDVTAAGTYSIISPSDSNNKRGARVYSVTVGASDETTTTTETTTEATTKAVEASTETTTAAATAEAKSSYKFVASAVIESGNTVYSDDNATIVAAQKLNYTANAAGVDTVGTNTYAGFNVSTSQNTSIIMDNASKASNHRIALEITATKDCTINIDCKVNDTKSAYIAQKTGDNTYTSVASVVSPAEVQYTTMSVEAKAGETYYFIGAGTNVPIYGIDVVGTEETTTEASTETTTAVETSTETTTKATTETTTKTVETSTETTTKAADTESGYVFVPSAAAASGDELYSDDNAVISASQVLKYKTLDGTTDKVSDREYASYLQTDGLSTKIAVDGEAEAAYRIACKITAKKD